MENKIQLLDEQDIDFLFLQKFDDDFANLSATDFIEEILIKKFQIKHIVIGQFYFW